MSLSLTNRKETCTKIYRREQITITSLKFKIKIIMLKNEIEALRDRLQISVIILSEFKRSN